MKNLLKTVCCVLGMCLFLAACTQKQPAYMSIQPLTVACLGDSITSGYKLRNPKRNSFPSQLEKMTQAHWKVLNAGVPGATAIRSGDIPIWKQKEFEQLMGSSPDVVILLLGTNDLKDLNWAKRGAFEDDYASLIQRLKELPSLPKVFVGTLPPILIDYPGGLTNERARQLNEKIKALSAKTDTALIDLTQPLADKPFLFTDGLHPNRSGAKVLAEAVYDAIVTTMVPGIQ